MRRIQSRHGALMTKYILLRLLMIPVALVTVVMLTFSYTHTVQWDYAYRYPQLYRQLKVIEQRPESLVEAARVYLSDVAELDFGSLRSGEPIVSVVWQALKASLALLALALAISVPFGILIGVVASRWQQARPARWLTIFSTAGLAMPSFYVGSLLILASVSYALASGNGRGLPFPLAGFGWDLHLVFPTIALMVRPMVNIARVTANLLTAELPKQYVVAARSFGHSWGVVKRRLAFANVVAPIVLTIAGSLRGLVTDLILVEWLFYWPGIGRFLALALIPSRRTNMATSPYLLEPPFVAALMGVVTLIFLVADFLASVAVRVADPRLRVPAAEEAGSV